MLGDGQPRQPHACARTRRLVHLAEDQGGLVEDPGLLHLTVQVAALAGALADPGEHRETAVLLGDVVDHLLHDDRLADTGATEETDLRALAERADQVDDLDAGLEDLLLGRLLVDGRRQSMDRSQRRILQRRLAIDRLADDVEHAAQCLAPDGNLDGSTGVLERVAATQPIGGVHGDGPHGAVAQVLLHLEDEAALVFADALEGEVDVGKPVSLELDIHHRADHLHHRAGAHALLLAGLLLGDCHLCALLRPGWDSARQRGCAADDFHQFGRDRALPHRVGGQRQVQDQVVGIV